MSSLWSVLGYVVVPALSSSLSHIPVSKPLDVTPVQYASRLESCRDFQCRSECERDDIKESCHYAWYAADGSYKCAAYADYPANCRAPRSQSNTDSNTQQ